jgi:MFS family permease
MVRRLRDRAVAVWTGVAAAGGAAGLVLGGLIASGPGWRWVFLLNVPIGIAALAATPRLAPAGPARPRAGGLDVPGAVAATTGLALLVLGFSERGAVRVIGLAGAAAALLALEVHERRASDPLLPPRLLGDRRLGTALLAAAVLTATTSGGGVLASLHLQDALGLGPAAAGLVLLPLSGAVVAGSVAAGRLRAPASVVLAVGVALVAVGSAVAALALSRAGLVAWGVLAGAGLGAASVAATTLGTSAAGADGRGTAAGLMSTAAQVGTAVGVAALVLVAEGPGTAAGFAAAAALAVSGLAASALRRDR